jgi:hypothetical protein
MWQRLSRSRVIVSRDLECAWNEKDEDRLTEVAAAIVFVVVALGWIPRQLHPSLILAAAKAASKGRTLSVRFSTFSTTFVLIPSQKILNGLPDGTARRIGFAAAGQTELVTVTVVVDVADVLVWSKHSQQKMFGI